MNLDEAKEAFRSGKDAGFKDPLSRKFVQYGFMSSVAFGAVFFGFWGALAFAFHCFVMFTIGSVVQQVEDGKIVTKYNKKST